MNETYGTSTSEGYPGITHFQNIVSNLSWVMQAQFYSWVILGYASFMMFTQLIHGYPGISHSQRVILGYPGISLCSFFQMKGVISLTYSIVYINEISVEMSKFVPCRFRATSWRAKARTRARCCPRSLPIAWEGFSTISSAHRASIQRNSMPAIDQLLLPKFPSTYFP